MFFFLYTGDFEFALLKSQGFGRRMHEVEGNGRSSDPPLCSPKSICYLAIKVPDISFEGAFPRIDFYQLRLKDLEVVANEDIAAKTSARNIVREAFSKSTAR